MPRLRRNFDPVEPTTQRWFWIDFSLDLAPGETITGASFTCTLVRGNDTSPALRVLTAASVNGTWVGAFCGNFVGGTWYSMEATATTNLGNVLPNNARVYCQGPADR